MPYFAIKSRGGTKDIGVCVVDSIDEVDADLLIGPGDWETREITEDEANRFADEWAKEPHPDDVCPICAGPRSRSPRGDIFIRRCYDCGFES